MSNFTVGVLTFVVDGLLALATIHNASAGKAPSGERAIALVVNAFVVAVVALAAFRLI